jgi:hypothetical protein
MIDSPSSELRVVTPVAIVDSMLTSSSIAESDHTAWSGATTYAAGTRVRVVSTNRHEVYESLQAGNLNKDPTLAANAAWWALVGPTNRWAMFDASGGTVSSDATEIDVQLAPGRIDTLALMDVNAATARVRMSTIADGTFFDQTWTLTGAADAVSDWWEYFYSPIGTQSVLVVPNLPSIGDATLRVTLTRTGGTVSLGTLVVGLSASLGTVVAGARPGIIDYSAKTTDTFGRTTLVQRTYARRADLSLVVERARVDAVIRTLAAMRASLALWLVGGSSTRYEALQLYGWFRDFDVTISSPNYSALSLQIEGIT